MIRCLAQKKAAYCGLFCALIISPALAAMQASDYRAFESAMQTARVVAQAHVLNWDRQRGVQIQIDKLLSRPHTAEPGPDGAYWLDNSQGMGFLQHTGLSLVLFVRAWQTSHLQLVAGPATGGLIWQQAAQRWQALQTAARQPDTALLSPHRGIRLSATYFVCQRSPTADPALYPLLEQALADADAMRNQAAIACLQHWRLWPTSPRYHPGFRPSLKRQRAKELAKDWPIHPLKGKPD